MQDAELGMRKYVIAHRGASAYAPEHTLDAYRLAIAQGADFVEQDLVVTKDGVLVCLHDVTLERTTDAASRFPRRGVQEVSGDSGTRHWFAWDFTLEELRQLDNGYWFGPAFAGRRIPTFDEAIATIRARAGLYPELKRPELYRSRGIAMEQVVADSLRRHGLVHDPATPVILQSFEEQSLRTLSRILPEVPRVFLLDATTGPEWIGAEGLCRMKAFATGVAPHKAIVERAPAVVGRAHAEGLSVTTWTFRTSDPGRYASVEDEMRQHLYSWGVDAVFTDNPDRFPR
jgi:glycerophosphoryl diester phosphodiesterase